MSTARKRYTQEFKTETVEYLLKSGKKITEVSKSLDIKYWLLSRWKIAYLKGGKKAFAGKPDLTPEQLEIKRLKKELENAKMEKDILKKAMAIFSKNE